MEERLQNIPVEFVQCDEIWGYVFKKEKHRTSEEANDPHIGDAYTFVGIDAKTKLILCFELGKRDGLTTLAFIEKLKRATSGRYQLTTDGFRPYVGAVEEVFGADIDFAQLVKLYSGDEETRERYSPGEVVETIPVPVQGDPDPSQISTSYVERQNLTMRMCMRRLTRLTNGFSKKWDNLKAALALNFAHYNFCRVHQTLRVTPAMEAGITDHVFELSELLAA
jgi:IS1 family transposase